MGVHSWGAYDPDPSINECRVVTASYRLGTSSGDQNSLFINAASCNGAVSADPDPPTVIRWQSAVHALMIASARVEEHLLDASAGASRVHVTGDFGYYLPVGQTSGIMPPRYLATYAVESGTPDMPILSRRSLVGLSVSDPKEVPVDLLGPR